MHDLEKVTAVILAGGLGTRLRSVVADRPKVLAEIQGRPFLAYLLDQLAAAGIRSAVLCTGYMGDRLKDRFGEAYGNLRLLYSQEPSPLGTAGALRLALPLLASDSVLVMNGDSFCDSSLGDFWTWHFARGADATLLLAHVPYTSRYGRVHVDEDGKVVRFDEKGRNDEPGWINAGIYLFKRQLIEAIPAGAAVSLEREIFLAWVGKELYGYKTKGSFLDIGTPESLAMAERFFASRVAPARL